MSKKVNTAAKTAAETQEIPAFKPSQFDREFIALPELTEQDDGVYLITLKHFQLFEKSAMIVSEEFAPAFVGLNGSFFNSEISALLRQLDCYGSCRSLEAKVNEFVGKQIQVTISTYPKKDGTDGKSVSFKVKKQ